MKRNSTIFCFVLLLSAQTIWAQYASQNQQGDLDTPYFEASTFYSFDKTDGTPLLRLYLQFVNDNLTFIKNDSGFIAQVQIDVLMSEKDHDFVFNRSFNRDITTSNFALTNSREATNTLETDIPVEPGRYDANIIVMDKNTNKQFNRKLEFTVYTPGLPQKGVSLSDIVFFSRFETDSAGNISSFQPNLTSNFSGAEDNIYAYFNTFTQNSNDSIQIVYKVKDDQGLVVQQNRYGTLASNHFMEHFIRLNRYTFNRTRYSIEISVGVGDNWVVRNNIFSFFWKFAPNTIEDLDLALKQLKYIAPEDSVKYFLKREFDEKRAFFQRYWKRHDPNPDTEVNELMEEYYRRVNFSNQNFSITGVPGWLTDRGRIYIKFGQPDDIERHPFEAESYPYVIWRYYSLQKNFLYIDRTGFGDYVLHPSYYYVEYE